MTPGARVAAAIAVLDQINGGAAAEQALTAWARGSRYAGSKDRAAVRDHVFDVLRARRSLGDGDGRSLMMQLALREGWPVDAIFSGEGHAPAPLAADEAVAYHAPTGAAGCDIPDWLWPHWQESLGADAVPAAHVLQQRADVFVRVNQRRGTASDAIAALSEDGVTVVAHPTISGCLRVIENPRRIKLGRAYLDGLVELQDAASQKAIADVPLPAGARLLDFCAGGGGKALGIADRHDGPVFAHDIASQRMKDIPERAARAGVAITRLATQDVAQQSPFDVVFCDAPCSGAGTWRRTPDAKWGLTPEKLASLCQSQRDVLGAAASLVKPEGVLIYATCSVLNCENVAQLTWFTTENSEFSVIHAWQDTPTQDGDGFYFAALRKS